MDADAQAFITDASITDATQKGAINQLVLDLKAASIWTKIVAAYPFVGGTSLKHSYNLRNTSQYQMTFLNSWTHDANGITGNGGNTYAFTGISASAVQTSAGGGFSLYNRTNNAGTYYDFSNSDNNELMALKWSDNNLYVNAGGTGLTGINNPNPVGVWVVDWDGSNVNATKNGVQFQNRVKTVAAILANNYVLGAAAGSLTNFTNRNYAFCAVFNDFLTAGQHTAYYNAINQFSTTLGR
jgi:hypothetical protein